MPSPGLYSFANTVSYQSASWATPDEPRRSASPLEYADEAEDADYDPAAPVRDDSDEELAWSEDDNENSEAGVPQPPPKAKVTYFCGGLCVGGANQLR